MKINAQQLRQLIEAAIFAADKPISIERLKSTVLMEFAVSTHAISSVIDELMLEYATRGVVLKELASGYRFQTQESLSPFIGKLWQESPPRFSRALLETLALIAYRQPITRGEIEQIRGVAVSSQIIKTLLEREWIYVQGQKDVAGRPALYATTNGFLDYFGLTSLTQLPEAEEFLAALQAAQEPITPITPTEQIH